MYRKVPKWQYAVLIAMCVTLIIYQGRHSHKDTTDNDAQSQSDFTCTISIITYNRVRSLQRLLKSLSTADYRNDMVSLLINVEAGAPSELLDYVHKLEWPHGSKDVRVRVAPSGLIPAVVESWYPSSDADFGLLLEDDIEVSPYFYNWIRAALTSLQTSEMYQRTFGISLYTPRMIETTNPYRRYFPDIELQRDVNAFFHQIPCSWGALQFPGHWSIFVRYMRHRLTFNTSFSVVPGSRTNGWTDSWKKFYIEFAWMNGFVMLYPNFRNQTSFSTNHLEQGVHITTTGLKHNPSDYVVPLHVTPLRVGQLHLHNFPILDVFNIAYNTDPQKILSHKTTDHGCLANNGYTGETSRHPVGNKLLSGFEIAQSVNLVSTPITSGKFSGNFFIGSMQRDGIFQVNMFSSEGKMLRREYSIGIRHISSAWEYSLQLDTYGLLRIAPRLCFNRVLSGPACEPTWESSNSAAANEGTYTLHLGQDGALRLYDGCPCPPFAVVWQQKSKTLPFFSHSLKCSGRETQTLLPGKILSSASLNTIVSAGDKSGHYYEGVMQPDGNFVVYRNPSFSNVTPVFKVAPSTHDVQCLYKLRITATGNLQLLCNHLASQNTRVLWESQYHGVAPIPHFLHLSSSGSLEVFQGYNLCDKGWKVWSSNEQASSTDELADCPGSEMLQRELLCEQFSPDVYTFFAGMDGISAMVYTKGVDEEKLQHMLLQLIDAELVRCVVVIWRIPRASKYVDSFIRGKLVKHHFNTVEFPGNLFFPSQHITTAGVLVINDEVENVFRAADLSLLHETWLLDTGKVAAFPYAESGKHNNVRPNKPMVLPNIMLLHKQHLYNFNCGPGKEQLHRSEMLLQSGILLMASFLSNTCHSFPLNLVNHHPHGDYGVPLEL